MQSFAERFKKKKVTFLASSLIAEKSKYTESLALERKVKKGNITKF